MPNPISGGQSTGDDRKELLEQFQNKSLEYAAQEKERVEARRQEHQAERDRFAAQGAAYVAAEAEAVQQAREDRVAWKQRQAEQKAAVAKMKADKERAEREQKERDAKTADFEKKRKAYFESLQVAGIRNAMIKKRDQDAKTTLELELHRAEQHKREASLAADQAERLAKDQSERELRATQEVLQQEFKHGMQKLHAEEMRKRTQMIAEFEAQTGQLPKGGPETQAQRNQAQLRHNAKLRALEQQCQKERTEFEADIGLRKQQAQHQALQNRTAAEHDRRHARDTIEHEYIQKVAELRHTFDRVTHEAIAAPPPKKL